MRTTPGTCNKYRTFETQQSDQSNTDRNMCRSLLILLLIAGVLLISTEGQQDYHTLTGIYKDAVDKAIQHCNEKSSKHVNFLGFLPDSEKSGPFYIELHLKVTTCTKTEKTTHRDDCPFMDRRPKINCAVCNKGIESGLDIHCAAQLQVNQFMEERRKVCPIHVLGAGSVNSLKKLEKPPAECLGCF